MPWVSVYIRGEVKVSGEGYFSFLFLSYFFIFFFPHSYYCFLRQLLKVVLIYCYSAGLEYSDLSDN